MFMLEIKHIEDDDNCEVRAEMQVTHNGNIIAQNWNCGDPKDNSFFRDWSRVGDLIMRAYKLGRSDAVGEAQFELEELMLKIKYIEDGADHEVWTEMQVIHNGNIIAQHYDGGEPEDNSFFRDWSWVGDLIMRAYKLGRSDAVQGNQAK